MQRYDDGGEETELHCNTEFQSIYLGSTTTILF